MRMMVVALEIDDIPCTTFFCLGKLTEVNCRKSVSARKISKSDLLP